MPILRLDIGYDGTGFHGYASQPGVPTVQGVLEEAIGRVLGEVQTAVAGRTDAGVHARHQVVSVSSAVDVAPDRLAVSLRRLLPPTVAVWRVQEAPDGFDARFDAVERAYRYRIDRGTVADPFAARYAWHVPDPLDEEAMSSAATDFVGDHDFASFCRRAKGRSTHRTVFDARWERDGRTTTFVVAGTSFCHQQVRSFVGYLVEVGRGRLPADGTGAVLAARDRAAARAVAPARGLTLWQVTYPPGFAEPPDLP